MLNYSNVYIYIGVYLSVSAFLLFLAAYIFTRSIYRIDGRLIFFTIINFTVMSFLEFIRHISPIEYSPFISQFLIGPISVLALSTTLHLAYTLSTVKKEFNIPLAPYIFYVPVAIHFVVSYFYRLNVTNFYQKGPWIHRDAFEYDLWIFTIIGIVNVAIILIFWKGSKKTHEALRRAQLVFLLRGAVFIALIFISFITFFKSEALPPVPTILLGFLTSVLITIGLLRFNLSPSLVERYRIMFDLSPTALLVLDENLKIIEMNKKAKQSFPKKSRNSVASLFASPYNQKQATIVLQQIKKYGAIDDYLVEFEHPYKNTKYTYSVVASAIKFGDETHYYIMWRDVSEDIEREKLIQHLAYNDSLTSIYNRTYFVPNASRIIEKCVMSDDIIALILLDLNFFKLINDTYGHAIGDLVLIKTANILKTALPGHDPLIARLGGDEFVLLVKNLPNKDYIKTIISQLRYKFEQSPFENHKNNITISPSIGYALAPQESIYLDELIQIADKRMYEDKIRIKNKADKASENPPVEE